MTWTCFPDEELSWVLSDVTSDWTPSDLHWQQIHKDSISHSETTFNVSTNSLSRSIPYSQGLDLSVLNTFIRSSPAGNQYLADLLRAVRREWVCLSHTDTLTHTNTGWYKTYHVGLSWKTKIVNILYFYINILEKCLNIKINEVIIRSLRFMMKNYDVTKLLNKH